MTAIALEMTQVDHLVLSPHADDAVWSVGGRLARWRLDGESCTVVTIFDGDVPAAQDLPDDGWRSIAEPSLRRREDLAALRRLDCHLVSLGLPDAALRTSGVGADARPRYRSARRLFGPIHPADEALIERLREALAPHLATADRVHVPLAAGHHVDHRLVRMAVTNLLPAARARWYEDFPYLLDPRDHEGLRPVVEPLDATHVQCWMEAAAEYESQAEALLGSTARLRGEVRARAAEHGRSAGFVVADRHWQSISA